MKHPSKHLPHALCRKQIGPLSLIGARAEASPHGTRSTLGKMLHPKIGLKLLTCRPVGMHHTSMTGTTTEQHDRGITKEPKTMATAADIGHRSWRRAKVDSKMHPVAEKKATTRHCHTRKVRKRDMEHLSPDRHSRDCFIYVH